MIKNIIFDLGNVIVNFNQDKIISNITEKEEEKIFIKEKIFNSEEWTLLDLGELTNDELVERMKKREDAKYSKLIELFFHEWYKFQTINEETVEIARKLKNKNYNIYVLSNMAKETFEYFKNIDFFKLCDGIIISSKEHMKKPDERIFNLLLKRYNLKSEECLFIDDDDTNRSFDTANKIGILGRRVIPNEPKDVIKLLDEFEINIF